MRARVHRSGARLKEAADRYEDAYNELNRYREAWARNSPVHTDVVAQQRRIAAEWADVLVQLNRQRDADRVLSRAKELR